MSLLNVVNKFEAPKLSSYLGKMSMQAKNMRETKLSSVGNIIIKTDKFFRRTGTVVNTKTPMTKLLENLDPKLRKALETIIGKAETVELKMKAGKDGRTSILGFVAKKGDKAVSKGAISVSDAGQGNAVAKWRIFAGPKGKNANINGFVDLGKEAKAQDALVDMGFKNGNLIIDAKVGKAAAQHVEVNPAKVAKAMKDAKLSKGIDIPRKTNVSQDVIDNVRESVQELIGQGKAVQFETCKVKKILSKD